MIKREVVYPILLVFVAIILLTIFRIAGVSLSSKNNPDDGGSVSTETAVELER